MDNTKYDEELIRKKIKLLMDDPTRKVESVDESRRKYLSKAEEIKTTWLPENPAKAGVNKPVKRSKSFLFMKESKPMFAKIVGAISIVSFLLGGTGVGTVYASQSSLPGETLYPVKTWSEDLRLNLNTDIPKELDLNLDFAERRVDEIIALVEAGEIPPDELLARLYTHLQDAEDLALSSENPEAAFGEIAESLIIQEQTMLKLQDQTGDQTMLKTQIMLHTRLQTATQSQTREQIQVQDPIKAQEGALEQKGEGPKNEVEDKGAEGPATNPDPGNQTPGEQNQEPGNVESPGNQNDEPSGQQSGNGNDEAEVEQAPGQKSLKTKTPTPKAKGSNSQQNGK
ncbi:MAG: hypothetical protein JEZ06_24305 [Anaerolineaceae bacterium]|nr:hypothetical protein [Anaerolineaceae bacterium]